MKKMKKILAFVMAMAMVLGMSVTAFASGTTPNPVPNPEPDVKTENVTGTASDVGYIAVKGIDSETKGGASAVEVYAYKIVAPEYSTTPDAYFTSKYKGLVSTLNGADGYLDSSKLTDVSILADLKENMKPNDTNTEWSYTNDSNVKGSIVKMDLQQDGSYKANVSVGSYLVLVKGAEAKFYSPIVVSASYVVKEGDSALESDTLNIENGVSWVKVSDTPTFKKEAETTNTDKISANVGDVVSYKVTIGNIPNYDGAHPKFEVTDTLSEGLDLEKGTASDFANSVVVKVEETTLTLDTDYTVTVDSTNARKFTVNFVVDSKYMLKTDNVDYTGKSLTIEYKAKVNSNAKMNSVANDNDAKLTYSKDSNIDGEEGKLEDKTYNYTFDLSGDVSGSKTESMVDKVGKETTSSTDSVALPGAEFTLYTEYDAETGKCSTPYDTDLIENGIVVSGNADSSSNPDNNPLKGELVMRGLAAGTYYLQETKAPAGYSINTDVYQIVINAVYYLATDIDIPQGKEVGELKSWTVVVKNLSDPNDTGKTASFDLTGGSNNTTIDVDIPNTHLSSLPSTGGIGTTIFTIGGCAIMIIAAGLFFASRRKSSK